LPLVFGSSEYQLSDADRNKILDYHNQIRANYNLPPLVYSLALETNASNYAGRCIWGHSTSGGKYGENLAQYGKSPAPTFPLTTWMSQVNGWYDEYKYWSCPDNGCTSVCGHLTQIVSKSSTAVGCGVGDCDPGTVSSFRSQYMVCQYSPPGNVNLGSKHPVTGLAYPYSGCPSTNPPLKDGSTPVNAPPVSPPTAPPTQPPVAPSTPVKPPSSPVSPPVAPAPGNPWAGCKGDYWPGNPAVQKITPCNGAPKTFLSGGVKKLYCDVKDPSGYYWPVLNPGTPECNYVAKLEEDNAATNGGSLPYQGWIGIALGILVIIIIIVVIVVLVLKKRAADERV